MGRTLELQVRSLAFVTLLSACSGSGGQAGGNTAQQRSNGTQNATLADAGSASTGSTGSTGSVATQGGGGGGDPAAVGAGQGDAGSSTKLAGTLRQKLSVQLADAICDAKEACIGEYRLLELSGGEPCRPGLEQRLAYGLLAGVETSVTAGLLNYDAAKMNGCLNEIRGLVCDVRPTRLPSKCRDALAGTVSLGDACNTDMDCVGAAYCDQGETATCPGVCAARIADGDPCSGDNSCQDGLICENVDENTKFVCTAPRKEGERCRGLYDPMCELDLGCFVKGPLDLYHVCKPLEDVYVGGMGDTCISSWGLLCQDDPASATPLTCYGATRTCGPALQSGDSCSLAAGDPCPMDEYCNTTSGQCEARVGANEPCHPARPRYCADGHACLAARVGGKMGAFCLPMAKLDEACIVSGQCFTGFCDPTSGTCQAEVLCQ